MEKLNNPHDKFFKALMSNEERARTLLNGFLPNELCEQLDFDSLKHQNGSFVSKELSEYFSDVVFSIKLKAGLEQGLEQGLDKVSNYSKKLFSQRTCPKNHF